MTNEPSPLANHTNTTLTTFIETQFPIAKLSAESYKERKAGNGQILPGLGKWWGRKPLILVRATLLGLLLPSSDNPGKDREIFLKLLTMDDEGLRQRKTKKIASSLIYDYATSKEQRDFFVERGKWRTDPEIAYTFMDEFDRKSTFRTTPSSTNPNIGETSSKSAKNSLLRRLRVKANEEKDFLEKRIFTRLPYSVKLNYCLRPEEIEGPTDLGWHEINTYLGTNATSLVELVQELGIRRFGHVPRVGDAFCGGGSIPFETARMGCEAYGSDLNPVATLLTWGALNIIGGGEKVVEQVQGAQASIYTMADQQIREWGIEENEQGWRADAFLYCAEVKDPESGWLIPLAPSWVIAESSNTIAKLVPDSLNNRYKIEVHTGVSNKELEIARKGTVINSKLVPPNGEHETTFESLRRNLRMWENEDLIPRSNDIFQERLYCIRWVETYMDQKGNFQTRLHYLSPTKEDFRREMEVLDLLESRFMEWQRRGYVPSRRIESGYNTDQPVRERGWTHWHHLFNPRQILYLGLLRELSEEYGEPIIRVASLLGLGKVADWSSRLSRWVSQSGKVHIAQSFSNQALNTLYNWATRGLINVELSYKLRLSSQNCYKTEIAATDARKITKTSDIWITDPPYADAVNYEEISEFFLAWSGEGIKTNFPDWYADSKRALAIKGNGQNFRLSMVECYQNLTRNMPDNGMQVVMFTHQDAGVWADLTLILWAAGLRVTAAWCIATETDSALKAGNYVQGTVLLVLRKRTSQNIHFIHELYPQIQAEVERQLDGMTALDDESDPNFGDSDYQLAAYAAALRVLTEHPLGNIDPDVELRRKRGKGEVSEIEKVIRDAVKVALDYRVPQGIEQSTWRTLSPMERFYLKGLEMESRGEHRVGAFQELARGFGATEYGDLMASTKSNESRLKNASEFGTRQRGGTGFGGSLLRHLLYAIHITTKKDNPREGLSYLRGELTDYWTLRTRLIHLAEHLQRFGMVETMKHWQTDAHAAMLMAGVLRGDHV